MAKAANDLVRVLYQALRRWWSESDSFQFGAAIAYYAVFAITPLAVISISIAGWLFGDEAAEGELASQIAAMVGPILAQAIQQTITRAQQSGTGVIATLLGLGFMIVGAMGVFTQLQRALNFIWGVQFKPGRSFMGIVRDSLLPFLMVLSAGALLILALLASAVLAYLEDALRLYAFPGGLAVWHVLDWLASLVLLTFHFAMVYKLLPAVRIAWSVVWLGASVTALLFTLGNYVIGFYVAHMVTASAFGAAGSLVMV
jgi:membrane protein